MIKLIVILVAALFIPVAACLIGGLMGLIASIWFSDEILNTLNAFGIKGISMWQLGVTFGFFSLFVRNLKLDKT